MFCFVLINIVILNFYVFEYHKADSGRRKKIAPEGSWTCISFVCMLSRKQALYTGHRKKLKSDGASNWTLNSTGSPQDNTIMSQANAHFKTLLVYYVTYYVACLAKIHKINPYTNIQNTHTQPSNRNFWRAGSLNTALVTLYRTCWYCWSFHQIYQYQFKEKYL